MLANRRLGAWLLALSCTANTVNAWLLMTIAGAAFAWGWSAAWIAAAFVVGAALNLFFVAPRLRAISLAQGNSTLFQLLSVDAGDRLQPWVARSAIVIFLLCVLLQTSAMLRFAGGLLVDEFGFNLISMALTSVTLVTVCAFSGGLACDGCWRCRAGDRCWRARGIVVIAGDRWRSAARINSLCHSRRWVRWRRIGSADAMASSLSRLLQACSALDSAAPGNRSSRRVSWRRATKQR